MRKARFVCAAAVIFLAFAVNAGADVIWNETGDGPLSAVAAAPTVVTLVSASDLVVGDGSIGLKYLTFTVPVGETVSSIIVDPGTGGLMTANFWLFSNNASSPANCGEYQVLLPTEILSPGNCALSLATGDYTLGLNVVTTTPWTVAITSTVPVELQSFSIE